MNTLTPIQVAIALDAYRKIEGRTWKCKLKADWLDGNYYYVHRSYIPTLQRFRNEGGLELLDVIHTDMLKEEIEAVLLRFELYDLLDTADCIIVDESPLLSSWEIDVDGFLSYSFVPDENCDAEEYEIEISNAQSIAADENGKWQVVINERKFEIACFSLNTLRGVAC